MSQFKIRFRDQQTGRQLEVDAKQVEGGWRKSTTEASFDKAEVGDGKVDMMVQDHRYVWDYNRHLGIDTEQLSSDDAQALKRALEDPRSANVRVFDMMAGGRELSDLRVLRTDAAGELTAITDNLDTTGSRRPVQLTPGGHIATPEGGEPGSPQEIGEGLFRAASLIDDVKGNLFDEISASAPLKEKMLDNLIGAIDSVAPGQPIPDGMDGTQALQMRSSAATTLLELLTSQDHVSDELRNKAFDAYETYTQQETNPMLRDSMAMHLDRLRDTLPASFGERIDALQDVANVKPPYEKWFADGNDTVKVDWSVGHGEGFLEDNIAHLKSKGFKVTSETNGHPVMEKTFVKDGVETTFEVHFRTMHNDMFAGLDDDDTHISIYSGHSNWGRNVRDSLKHAPEATGEGKVIMSNLCVGKGEMQQMLDAYPDSQLITTVNSGYFRPGDIAEWHPAVDALFEGIAARDGYESISETNRARNPFKYTHKRGTGIDNNYIFPTDIKARRELLDQDHDGQADVFDRMVNFNSFKVETDTAREFQPITPARDADELVGTKIHFAAMSTNRISIYNEALKKRNGTAEILPGGYHEPTQDDAGLFRFTPTENGRISMSMDADFAHMSEEALRMASAFEYSLHKSEQAGWPLDNKADNLLFAMVLASQSLNSDAGYRDRAVWGEFLKAYNLPNISLSDVASARGADSHWYSGSLKSVDSLKQKIGPDALQQLSNDGVGDFIH